MSLAELYLEQSPACHWVVDGAGAFIRVCGAAAQLFGKPGAELAGRTIKEALAPEAASIWGDRVARAIEGETVILLERCDGRNWHVTIFPILVDGEVRFAGGLARETTAWDKAEQELRHTVLGALKAMEFERQSVSRFLHDSVGQNLTAFGFQLDLMRMDVEDEAIRSRIGEMQAVLDVMMEKVRAYSHDLNPSPVERTGLRPALDRLAGRMRERFTGSLRINVDPSLKLDPKIATAMYHIAQEAVENAVQHASCSLVEIAVKSTRSGIFLEVRDNGRGFDPADLRGGGRGLGLLSMEHYAAQAGLELAISSNRATGTAVRATAQEPT